MLLDFGAAGVGADLDAEQALVLDGSIGSVLNELGVGENRGSFERLGVIASLGEIGRDLIRLGLESALIPGDAPTGCDSRANDASSAPQAAARRS